MTDYNKRARELCGEKEDTGNPVRDGDCNEWINKAVPVVSGLLERAEKAEAKLNALREIDVDDLYIVLKETPYIIDEFGCVNMYLSDHLQHEHIIRLAKAIKAKITETIRGGG